MNTLSLRCFLLLLGLAGPAWPAVSVVDDDGRMVTLPAPAHRIVALSPHIVENLFAAGAGARVVGAVEYSDTPPAAKRIFRVGDYARIDLESLLALKPDLVIAWKSGTSSAHVARLRALGIPVFLSEPQRVEDVPVTVERFGQLAGSEAAAGPAVAQLRAALNQLPKAPAGVKPVRVFYQIWNTPLLTIGGRHFINDAINLCGGENVFAGLRGEAPTVTVEGVLAADPEAIVASGADAERPGWLADWQRWPKLKATARDNLFHVPPDLLQRPTPRLLEGVGILCQQMDAARKKRPAAN